MNQVKNQVRRVILGTAFMCVMAGTGGLLGAIAGVMLVLLSHVVLGMSAGIAELMPASVAFGTLAAVAFAGTLMGRHLSTLTWHPQPRLVPTANPIETTNQ